LSLTSEDNYSLPCLQTSSNKILSVATMGLDCLGKMCWTTRNFTRMALLT
ncbi:hypothetical protein NDU88_004280, partial [Pleurodeles waltl]